MKLALALVLAAVAAGCASSPATDLDTQSQDLGRAVDVPNPSGAYVARITANGSGCPAGTWNAAISEDGRAFTVSFSGYEAVLEPGQSFAVRDCQLSLDLRSPEGFSFSVSSFHYQGYALLDQPGMSARQTAKYYFQGNPVPATEQRTEMSGPHDASYTFSDEIGFSDLVWSPCGASRTLQAQTRIVAQNNAEKTGAAYVNTTSVDGEIETVLRFGLSWRRCDGGGGGADGPPHTRPIHRAYNRRIGDHLQGITQGEGAPQWAYEGISFHLYTDASPGRAPLYRCRAGSHHFLSRDARCENQVFEGELGYVSTEPHEGLVEIFRCVGGRDHLTTSNLDECFAARMRNEGSQGFARP